MDKFNSNSHSMEDKNLLSFDSKEVVFFWISIGILLLITIGCCVWSILQAINRNNPPIKEDWI